jgi:hypothetical protein
MKLGYALGVALTALASLCIFTAGDCRAQDEKIISLTLEIQGPGGKVSEIESAVKDGAVAMPQGTAEKMKFIELDADGAAIWSADFQLPAHDSFPVRFDASLPNKPNLARICLYDAGKNPGAVIHIKDCLPKPNALFFGKTDSPLLKTVREAGFNTCVADVFLEEVEDLKRFDLVVIRSYGMCSVKLADALAKYIKEGGGVMLFAGVPAILGIPEPYPPNNGGDRRYVQPDLTYISEWFGSARYSNQGGEITLVLEDAFQTTLKKNSVFDPEGGGSAAAIPEGSLAESTKAIAKWNRGGNWAFTNTCGDGRVYWQSTDGGEIGLELVRSAALWLTRRPSPELSSKIADLVAKLGAADAGERRCLGTGAEGRQCRSPETRGEGARRDRLRPVTQARNRDRQGRLA